jgi:hypothetical protein
MTINRIRIVDAHLTSCRRSSQRYPANLTFDPDIIRLMIPLNCALGARFRLFHYGVDMILTYDTMRV